MDVNVSKLQEMVKDREAWRAAVREAQRVRHDGATEQVRRRQGTSPKAVSPKKLNLVFKKLAGDKGRCRNASA